MHKSKKELDRCIEENKEYIGTNINIRKYICTKLIFDKAQRLHRRKQR